MAKYSNTSVQGFTDYMTERGRDIPGTWTEEMIDAALLVASEWIDGVYGRMFAGQKAGGFLQDREWPRTGAYSNTYPVYTFPSDVIPEQIASAVYEAAFRQATNPGSLLVDYTPGKYKRVAIEGALSVEYASFTNASEIQTQFGIIDMILEPLLAATGMNFASFTGVASRV